MDASLGPGLASFIIPREWRFFQECIGTTIQKCEVGSNLSDSRIPSGALRKTAYLSRVTQSSVGIGVTDYLYENCCLLDQRGVLLKSACPIIAKLGENMHGSTVILVQLLAQVRRHVAVNSFFAFFLTCLQWHRLFLFGFAWLSTQTSPVLGVPIPVRANRPCHKFTIPIETIAFDACLLFVNCCLEFLNKVIGTDATYPRWIPAVETPQRIKLFL
eukprot:scaffold34617_cov159-Amphora_coffeaeformis.AAC.2